MIGKGTSTGQPGSTLSPGKTVGAPKLIYGVTIGRSAFALMRGQLSWFASRGWNVTLACAPDTEATLAVERERVAFYGIAMEREISPISDVRSLLGWISFLRRDRPDAINVGTPKAGLLGGVAAWLTRVPKRIYVVRGLRLEGATGAIKPILWVMERISSAVATDVVVVSRSLAKELLARKLVAANKSWLIGKGSSNGVDARKIAAQASQVDPHELAREIGLSQDALVLGFVGRRTKDKGIRTLIEAVRSGGLSVNVEVVIIGEATDVELERELGTLGDRVHVLPWTKDLWTVLPVLDVLCLPTRREGFPNVVLEAASMGVPAVTTRATGAVDSVVDGESGFVVDVDDPDALVEAVNKYAIDPALAKRHGIAAKARVHQDFIPETIWRGLESLLHNDYGADFLTRLDRL